MSYLSRIVSNKKLRNMPLVGAGVFLPGQSDHTQQTILFDLVRFVTLILLKVSPSGRLHITVMAHPAPQPSLHHRLQWSSLR